MLNCPGDAAGNVQVAVEFLSGHTHIPVDGHILQGFCHRTGGAYRSPGLAGQIFNQFHIGFFADALTGTDHPFCIGDGGIQRNAHSEIVAVILQGLDQSGHLFFRGAVLEDLFLPGAGDGHILFGRTAVLGHGHLVGDVGSDDHPLDFVGAFVDGGDLGIPIEPFHIHALQVAGATKDLQGIVGDGDCCIRSIHLGHGAFHAVLLVFLFQFRSTVYQEPGCPEPGGHIRQFERNTLVLADGGVELDPFLGIVQCGFIGSLGNPQCLGCNADPAPVQGSHGDFEALAPFAQQVLFGQFHIVEDQFCRGRGADPQLVVVVPEGETGHAFFHDEGADAPGALSRFGDGKNYIGIGFAGVGDEDLVSVEDPVGAVEFSGGFRFPGIRTGIGFRQAEGADLFPGDQGHQVFPFLFFRPESKDRVGPQGYVGRQDDPGAPVHPGQFFHGNGVADVIQPGTAIFFGEGDAHPSQFSHFLNLFVREFVFLVQHERNGFDLGFRKSADLGTKFLVFLCGGE